jgi:tetratricopeptide (TPR) repeat protein
LQRSMLSKSVAPILCLAVLAGACTTSPDHTVAPHTPPPMPEAEREAELAELGRRFALADAQGWSPEQCAALEADYHGLAERSPEQPAPRFGQALVLEACGELERAESIYRSLADSTPRFAPALVNLGRLEWARGDLDGAIERFEQVVTGNPEPGSLGLVARNNLAAALTERYRRSGARLDFDTAERMVQAVLARDSDNQRAYENLARLYYERGRVEDPSYRLLAELVVTQGQRVLDRAGQASAEFENLRGLLSLLADDPARAIRAFQRAVEIDPEHGDAHRNLALVAIRLRDFDRAKRSLDRVLAQPEVAADVEVWLALGVAQRGLGDLDAAAAAYRRAIEIAPDDPRPWFNLGVLAQEHRVAFASEADEWIELADEAAEHFRVFVSKAADAPPWRESVAAATDRIVIAEDTVALLEQAAVSQTGLDELQEREAEEIERRLELEREATPVTDLGERGGSEV